MIWDALTLQLGYNAALVTVGATLLGAAAGASGAFLFLRKRSLVGDAVSHATLPGVGLAFLVMVAFGGDGRSLPGLLTGAVITSALGLVAVQALSRRTRLTEDAAIGAVLSVFFAFGIVVLTLIQSLNVGRQAGLEGFLLGSTAAMLFSDAVLIALGGAVSVALVIVLRRPMTLVAFDPNYAQVTGVNVARVDLAMMGLVLAVTIIGLKVVGLILIVALLIIPPVTARFWTEDVDRVIWGAAFAGALAGYLGTALSASFSDLPTGPIVVLVAFGLFVLSLVVAPGRGVVSAVWRHRVFQQRVHLRQGLLALAQGQPIYEDRTLRLLRRRGLVRRDGVSTDAGRALAAKTLRDEARWELARQTHTEDGPRLALDGLVPIEQVLTADEIRALDARLGPPVGVA